MPQVIKRSEGLSQHERPRLRPSVRSSGEDSRDHLDGMVDFRNGVARPREIGADEIAETIRLTNQDTGFRSFRSRPS